MFFAFDVDEYDHLSRFFWTDAVSRKNFTIFGDVVSFDATYQTNRYDMVFTPFTSVNNHKKSITFGAGLLTKEDIESYVWLFEKFKEAMGSEPGLLVTDQDPAMRVAFPRVFKEAKHRFCMWHIMSKVGDKVDTSLIKNETLRSKLNCVVWSHYLGPTELDHQWNLVKEEFGLLEHSWIVKTCRVLNVRDDQGFLYYDIKDRNDRVFSVVHNVAEVKASCGCKMFERVGLLCRHIFVVFKDLNLDSIPLVYVVNRWTKSASMGRTFDIDVVVDQCGGVDEKLVLLKNVWLDIQCCISMVQSDMDCLQVFSQIIKDHKDMLLAYKGGCSSAVDKRSIIESICGSSVPSEVSILPPNKAKNNGSGWRIKGCKEIAIEQSKERSSKTCNKTIHDSRNCLLRKMKDKVCSL
ncbi:PREDICTED: protein FAR1-RELATED SEQUENCE 5-like [Ipomoea nil]|uniref:protein FAR1-RELATED SEQUENCE 5-like n=1 Tax=Ipomoea nil TaxID=35883 RepID=UPI000900D975|nr:PREDICTED: protein FAR1-RELATED SEQUENCE 5-like [Ipomoea nil]